MKRQFVLLALAVAALAGILRAQEDAPGWGVARISLLHGDVSVRRGDSGDWVAAAVNAPLVVEDRVFAGPGSRAEIQLDWANMMRLSAGAEVRMAQLETGRYQLQVAQGTVTYRILRDSRASIEISTPSASVRPVGKGTYRITVNNDGSAEITVRSGEAEIFTPSGSQPLHAGQMMEVRGDPSDPEFQIDGAPRADDWDRWNEHRDHDLERARSYRYVDPSVYGAEDLDGQGDWTLVQPYGWVWAPNVAAGWAPYRYGRWTWLDWYGWTWISYDPWGWAPYHYGRWFWSANRWCWWPGGIGVRTWWRPALVGFVGWGGGSGMVGFGRIGWFPLAPYEPFHPWYGHGWNRGGGSVTIVNDTNITNVYRNARLSNAVTVVNGSDFSHGRVGSSIRVGAGDLQHASLVQGPVPVTPQRESLRLADRNPRPGIVPQGTENTRFYAARRPARIERTPFEQQQRGVQQVLHPVTRTGQVVEVSGAPSGWRRVGSAAPAVERGSQPVPRSAVPEPRTESPGNAGGWTRFGQPEYRNPAAPPARGFAAEPPSRESSGWTSFGRPERATPTRYQQPAPRNEAPRYAPAPARMETAPRGGGYRAPAPPRSAPSPSYGGGGGGHSSGSSGGGGGRSGGGGGGGHSGGGGGRGR